MFTHKQTTVVQDGTTYSVLLSTPDVHELITKDDELAVLAIVNETSHEIMFFDYNDARRMNIGYNTCVMDQGHHDAGCVGGSANCMRCIAEMAYEDAIQLRIEARQLRLQIDLLTLVLATELQCDYLEASHEYRRIHGTCDGFVDPSKTVASRLLLWEKLSDEKRAEAATRAAKFRGWLHNLPPDPADED